ncbi:PspC domain-containing protein [Cryomorphaceae bacterium]|nr:PspC domain-containing protein [Cryomorphaceae bacterium]
MNKTVNINLAGIIFHVDEDAYGRLSDYLQALKAKFAGEPGGDEIIADVEARMAELFQSRTGDSKQVITRVDVDEVIAVLGEPEDYEDVEEDGPSAKSYEETSSSSSSSGSSDRKRRRRIFRNPDDAIIGGVAGGLGAYLNIDPVFVRLIFVLSFFGWGTGFLLYLVLWIIIPEARSTAEKLEMRGEDVNLNNIEKSIKEEIDSLKNRLNDLGSDAGKTARRGASASKRGIDKIVDLFLAILRVFVKLVLAIIGFSLIITAITIIIALTGAMFGASMWFVSWPDPGLAGIGFMQVQDLLFIDNGHFWLTASGLLLVVLVPLISIVALGARLLFKVPKMSRMTNTTLSILFGVGMILTIIGAIRLGVDFDDGGRYTTELDVPLVEGPIQIVGGTDDISDMLQYDRSVFMDITEDRIHTRNVHFDIERAAGATAKLQIRQYARGSNKWEARKRAEQITYDAVIDSGRIELPNHLNFSIDEKWRNQELYITLYLPKGASVYLNESAISVIDDIDNTTNTWDWDMVNHTWMMNNQGLSCMDCTWTEEEQEGFREGFNNDEEEYMEYEDKDWGDGEHNWESEDWDEEM